MKIGIPRGMSTFEYPVLYRRFFENLGIEVILSDETNKEILEEGVKLSIDENCLASKIYMGHVSNLSKRDDIDYILVPRICSFNKVDTICVKFYAMYDICKNVFKDKKIVTINIDYLKGETEFKAFFRLGRKLNKRPIDIINSYLKAKKMQKKYDELRLLNQNYKLRQNIDNPNILIVSHSYVAYDKYMGEPIVKYLKGMGANIVYTDLDYIDKKENRYKDISKSIYWKYSKNLLNNVSRYMDKVDGIIYLSVFPCGPDSLVNELAIRRVSDIPSINLILDEHDSSTGIYTRLESFMDILEQGKVVEMSGKEKIHC